MKALIGKSKIDGNVAAPPSKSYTIRALMCAALAKGNSHILKPLVSDDTRAAVEVLEQIGIYINQGYNFWPVQGGFLQQPRVELLCRDSAATFRFMTAIASLIPGSCRLVPGQSLSRRPIQPLLDALSQLGVKCRLEGKTVVVDSERLAGGTAQLPGDVSSQFITALLLIAPLASSRIIIQLTTPPESKPYLRMTLGCLEKFGIQVKAPDELTQFEVAPQKYKPVCYTIEGDWSSASYLLALGAACGQVTVTGLNQHSFQGDRIVLNLLQQMGVDILTTESHITVRKSALRAITADLSDCIDLLPTMAALAAIADGESFFSGISRARLKESNRVLAIKEGLERMGVPIIEEEDRLTISGTKPSGATIDSFDDHRIAMAFNILGSVAGDTIIDGAECVSKTYPDFWQVFENLGGEVKLDVK